MVKEKLKDDIMRQYAERLAASNRIAYCQMTLTHRCQYSCSHCYHKEIDGAHLDMSAGDATRIIGWLNEYSSKTGKILRVDFTGGDPLLYPQIQDLISYCCKKGILYGLKCNPDRLMLLTPQELKMLLPGCTAISLSLDGPKIYHDAIRGNGSFDKVINAAKIINQANIYLRINATISKANMAFLPELLQTLAQSDICVSAFTWARYWSLEESESVISPNELPAVFDAYLSVLECLYENAAFFLDTGRGKQPRIKSYFKDHLWLPHLFRKGYIDKDFMARARQITNSLNCSAMGDSFIVDSADMIYKCRKSSTWTIDLRNLESARIDDNYLGACITCSNKNVCLGCPAMNQIYRSEEEGCPYYEKAPYTIEL